MYVSSCAGDLAAEVRADVEQMDLGRRLLDAFDPKGFAVAAGGGKRRKALGPVED